MNGFKLCLIVPSLLLAGCAATTPETGRSAGALPAQAAAAAEAETETAEAASLTELRTIELTASELDTSSVITCRDIRSLGSNVFVTRCMTRADWKRFEQAQTMQAQEFLRRLRGEY